MQGFFVLFRKAFKMDQYVFELVAGLVKYMSRFWD